MNRPTPPLNAVRAFDAVARRLHFGQAAADLGVTQSAVSKQIAHLEDLIGAKLFERGPSGVALTLEGRELRDAIAPAFDIIAESFERFSRRGPRAQALRLATVASFAAEVVIPTLATFEAAHPGVHIDILTSDRLVDLAREEIDIAVRYGPAAADDAAARAVCPGALTPVCAPAAFATADGDVVRLLDASPRIQIFLRNEWRAWEAAGRPAATPAARALVLEHFLTAAAAARHGRGIALLPAPIGRADIEAGRLKQFADPIEWDQTFYIAHAPNATRSPLVHAAIAWLTGAA